MGHAVVKVCLHPVTSEPFLPKSIMELGRVLSQAQMELCRGSSLPEIGDNLSESFGGKSIHERLSARTAWAACLP
jgi:hypothetical protein